MPFGRLCLSVISMIFVKSMLTVYVGGYGGMSEADFVSSVNCIQSAFL